jgi:hypothetical protein
MRKNQLGISLGGLMVGGVIFIVIVMMGLKLAPSYLEFFAIKKVINSIALEKRGGATVNEIRKSFELRATVDDITSIKAADLEVAKEDNDLVISVAYRKEIPLVANIGIHIDFRATSKE